VTDWELKTFRAIVPIHVLLLGTKRWVAFEYRIITPLSILAITTGVTEYRWREGQMLFRGANDGSWSNKFFRSMTSVRRRFHWPIVEGVRDGDIVDPLWLLAQSLGPYNRSISRRISKNRST